MPDQGSVSELGVEIIHEPGQQGDPAEMRSLWETVRHIERIDAKIQALGEARQKALEAAMCAAHRSGMGRTEAREIHTWFKDRGIAGRGPICEAAGWHANRIFRPTKWPHRRQPCVYLLRAGAQVVYVGRTRSGVKQRVQHHLRDGREFYSVDIWICSDRREMRRLEADLIHQHFDSLENQRREGRVL